MATHSSSKSETIKFTSVLLTNVNYLADVSTNIILSDSATVHDFFKISIADTLSITESITFINSLYVKKVLDPGIIFADVLEEAITFFGYSETPSNIDFADVAGSKTTYTVQQPETINISDETEPDTTYVDKPPTASNINITDAVNGRVSKDVLATFKNAIAASVGTVETTLYTCNDNSAEVVTICLANKHTTVITVDVLIYKGGSTPHYILKDLSLDRSQAFVINNSEMNTISLVKTDEIRVFSSVDNVLDVFASIVEI